MKGGMANTRADRNRVGDYRKPVEPRDFVDVDEMRRACQPERHGRYEALAAGEHAAVLGRDFGKHRDCLFERMGRVIGEWRGLHRPRLLAISVDASDRCSRESIRCKNSAIVPAERAGSGPGRLRVRHGTMTTNFKALRPRSSIPAQACCARVAGMTD